LWRLRRDGALHSIKIAGRGMWLTSADEVARVESVPPKKLPLQGVAAKREGEPPPDIAKPRPSASTEGTGRTEKSNKPHLDSETAAHAQASSNGGAG
jgi:hypothetical protein